MKGRSQKKTTTAIWLHDNSAKKNMTTGSIAQQSLCMTNVILKGEKGETIPLKSRMRKTCPLFPYLFNIV